MNQLTMCHSSLVVSKKNQLQGIRQKEKLVETFPGSSQGRQETGYPELEMGQEPIDIGRVLDLRVTEAMGMLQVFVVNDALFSSRITVS